MSSSSDRFEDLDPVSVAQLPQRVLRARHHLAADRHGDPAAVEPELGDQVRHVAARGSPARLPVDRDPDGCERGFCHRFAMIRYAARVPSARKGGGALAASRGLGPAVAAIDLDALRANYARRCVSPPGAA